MKKSFSVFVIICSVIGLAGILFIGRIDPVNTASRDGIAMDTVIRLTASAPKPRAAIEKILDEAFGLIAGADKKFSMYDPDSEISAISEASGAEPVRIAPETYAALASALQAADITGGAFDPTMGGVTFLWRKALEDGRIPSDAEISSALRTVGYERLRLSAPDSAFLTREGRLDLGGIAKGQVSAMVRDYLRSEGVTSALIDLGGNVVAIGGRAERGERERSPWNIGVQHPSEPRGTPICVLRIYEGSVITAGAYERYWDVEGRRYSHIFDPANGRPAEGPLKSATIVSNDPALGDALSTAFMVMGETRALELLQTIPGCDAIFISEDGNGEYRILATGGLRDSLAPMRGGAIEFRDVE